jgi:putative DNA primase/helicase
VVSAEPGLERRVRVVEFPRSFKVGSPGLLMQLQAEASGILAWLVRGCLDWQRDGLYPCPF